MRSRLRLRRGVCARVVLAAVAVVPAWLAAQSASTPVTLRVDLVPTAPSLDRVDIVGDTVVFSDPFARDSVVFAFLRAERRFVRLRRAPLPDAFPHAGIAIVPRNGWNAGEDDFRLADSLRLVSIPSDAGRAAVVKFGARTIGLRGPRIAAEQRWRVSRGTAATPSPPETGDGYDVPFGPTATDWPGVSVTAVAVDARAVWLGTDRQASSDGEFALGGLLRVDRRTGHVEVITDARLFHAAIAEIQPWRDGYLILARDDSGAVALLAFDVTTGHARAMPLPRGVNPWEFAVAGDSAWFRADETIGVVDLNTDSATVRGFSLALDGDAVVYELNARQSGTPRALQAAIGAANLLRVSRPADFVRTAMGRLHLTGIEYYQPATRAGVVFRLGEDGAALDSADDVESGDVAGPTALFVTGLEAPALRPYLLDALRNGSDAASTVADVMVAVHDTAAIPGLRAALDSAPPFEAPHVALALALLGDSSGNAWFRGALAGAAPPGWSGSAPARRAPGGIHPAVFDAVARLGDATLVPRLRALERDSLYGGEALIALLDYRGASMWHAAVLGAMRDTPTRVRWSLFDRVATDTTGAADDAMVRDSVRVLARRVFAQREVALLDVAGSALARYGAADDLPALIEAVGADSLTYPAAVLTLARITGAGADDMPAGPGAAATREAAARWWTAWLRAHRDGFRPAAPERGLLAWRRMYAKVHGP